ncbi:MAG: hypothetical protein NDI69_09190 [Bacteriovoracaceae bacterium]|nr:hypothetical protein [Bacteriovoracaceae bacterium]
MSATEQFRRFWLQGIQNAQDLPGGLKEFLADTTKCNYESNSSGTYLVRLTGEKDLLNYLGFDIQRFALASFESAMFAEKAADFKSASWVLIQKYYSSYFAAHALMRLCGQGHTRLSKNITSSLSTYTTFQNLAPITETVFSFKISKAGRNDLLINLRPDGETSHEGFWKVFGDFLENDIKANLKDEEGDLSELLSFILRGLKFGQRNPIWLTKKRNSVNYLEDLSYWYPYSASINRVVSTYPTLIKRWKNLSITESDYTSYDDTDEFETFLRVTQLIISFCHMSMSELLNIANDPNKCFLNQNAVKFSNLKKLRILKLPT